MRTLTTSSLLIAGLALGGCTDRLLEPPPLGAANAQNKAAQIVDPVPEPTDIWPVEITVTSTPNMRSPVCALRTPLARSASRLSFHSSAMPS